MQPIIASYTDFSAQSVHKINPRYEALKSCKKVRKPAKTTVAADPPRPKSANPFDVKSVVLVDTSLPEKPQVSKPKKEKLKVKADLDNRSDYEPLNWNFKPWTSHREQWLFVKAKPESHFTPKCPVKKIPVSYAAVVVKNVVDDSVKRKNISQQGNAKEHNENYSTAQDPGSVSGNYQSSQKVNERDSRT